MTCLWKNYSYFCFIFKNITIISHDLKDQNKRNTLIRLVPAPFKNELVAVLSYGKTRCKVVVGARSPSMAQRRHSAYLQRPGMTAARDSHREGDFRSGDNIPSGIKLYISPH